MKKLTLVNVESQTQSVNVSNIIIRSRAPSVVEMAVPWRRRSRIRRILHELRRIRRSQPHIRLEYCRQQHMIYVRFDQDRDYTLFQLMWPIDCTPFELTSHWPTTA